MVPFDYQLIYLSLFTMILPTKILITRILFRKMNDYYENGKGP